MKITKLSYKKIEVEYKIPIVTNFNQSRPMEQLVKIRYSKDPSYRNKYTIIRGSVHTYLESLHFKYKVGKSSPSYNGYKIQNITPNYSKNVNALFEGKSITLVDFLDRIDISDGTFISKVRDKKLEELLG